MLITPMMKQDQRRKLPRFVPTNYC